MMQSVFVEHLTTTSGNLINRNYQTLQLLGQGTFGKVLKVQRNDDKRIFGLKVIPKALVAQQIRKTRLHRQIQLQQRVKHPLICQLYSVFEDQKNIHLLLQYVSGKNLEQIIRQKGKLTQFETKQILKQIIQAVDYLHSQNIIHRDLKPGNIMVDEQQNIKIIDFGFASRIQHRGAKRFSFCGSPQFMAPEIVSYGLKLPKSIPGYSVQVDIWAIGVLIYLMLSGKLPFDGETKQNIFTQIIASRPKKTEQFSNEAWNLLLKIFKLNPEKRLTLQKIKSHIFLEKQKPSSSSLSRLFALSFGRKDKTKSKKQVKIYTQLYQPIEPKQNISSVQNAYLSTFGLKSFKQIFNSVKKQSRPIQSTHKCLMANNNKSRQKNKTKSKPEIINNYGFSKNGDEQRTSTSMSIGEDAIFLTKVQKKDLCVYFFNNGMRGTYERGQNMQILFNPNNNTYSKIQKGTFLQMSLNSLQENYKKHIEALSEVQQMENIKSVKSIEQQIKSSKWQYIEKFYDIKAQKSYFFKLSNRNYQLLDHECEYAMIFNHEKDEFLYIQLKDGKVLSKKVVTQQLLHVDKRTKKMYDSINQAIFKTTSKGCLKK